MAIVLETRNSYPRQFQHLDCDKSGTIEFDEFEQFMREKVEERENADKQVFFEAFQIFDKDGSGTITADELKLVNLIF